MNSRSKLFIKPNIDYLDTSTQKLRRNLLISSVITIALCMQKVTMAKDIKFAGYNFEGLSVETLYVALLCITLYLLIDFIMSLTNHLRENHIRLTGLNTPKPRAGSSMGGHSADSVTTDERQSSLYSWWYGQLVSANELEKNLKNLIEEDDGKKIKENLVSIDQSLRKLKEKKIFINSALIRFERSFHRLIKMQYIRFLIFDFFTPAILGAISIGMCLSKVISS